MEKLLIADEIAHCLLCVFQLLELDEQDVVELLKVLLHIVNPKFGR